MVRDLYYWMGALAIAAGFVLSIISLERLCSQACSDGHNYRLLGLPLDPIGILLFANLGIVHYLIPKYRYMKTIAGLMVSGALGTEVYLIYLQKAVIGHWCPVCLSIAASLVVLACSYAIPWISTLHNRSSLMNSIKQLSSTALVALIGFMVAFLGMTKINPLDAAEKTIKDSLTFGNATSPIEVYVFTDWQCPACRKVEPAIEKMTPHVMEEAKLIFVDYIVHPESMNFSPYNISFMVNNKDKYWQLRHALTSLSQKTKTPSEEQVQKQIADLGVTYKELNFADTALGMKYFKQLGEQFKIEGTPTVVVINRTDKKGKKLVGTAEITEANVLQAIHKLKE